MDVFLHLGAHRTASTSFQEYVWTNRARLADAGLTQWTPRRTRDGLFDGLIRNPQLVTLDDEKRGRRSRGRLRLELSRLEAAGQSMLILTEENLLGTMFNCIEGRQLYPYLIERMTRYIGPFRDRPLKIGLAIRAYADYWASSLAFAVQRGLACPDQGLLGDLATQPRRWRHVIGDIARLVPEAELFVWTFERRAGAPRQVLERVLGERLPNGMVDEAGWHNSRAGFADLKATLSLRGETIHDDQINQYDCWMPFDERQRAALHRQYRKDLDWLASGADGLATYLDGRTTPALRNDAVRKLRVAATIATPIGGHDHGIEKGVG